MFKGKLFRIFLAASLFGQAVAAAPSSTRQITGSVITMDGQASAPSNPPSGYYKLYTKTDGNLYKKNSAGTESQIGGAGGSAGLNILAAYNPNAESGTTFWSETGGGTLGAVSQTGSGFAFSFDASAASDYAISEARAIPEELWGQNCLAEFKYKGFDSNITVQVHDGSNVIASHALTARTTWSPPVQINFLCPSSGNLQLKFLASGNAAIGYWTRVHLGSATNLSSYNGAIDLGTETWSDSWSNATTSVRLTQVGNRIFAEGTTSVTGAGSTNLTITIPSTYTPAAAFGFKGSAKLLDTGSTEYDGTITLDSLNTLRVWALGSGSTYSTLTQITATIPHTWANTDVVEWKADWVVANWSASTAINSNTLNYPTVQRLTSGTSQTYTTPAGVKYLKVTLCGAGGGGAGGGTTTTGGNGGAGGTTSFQTFGGGTTLFSATGGAGGAKGSSRSAGGTGSIDSSLSGLALTGGDSSAGAQNAATNNFPTGSAGGGSIFGSGGAGGQGGGPPAAGANGAAKCSGGGGAGNPSAVNGSAGGGAGGAVFEGLIVNPATQYTYTVGGGGSAGAAGTSGAAGGAGADGVIIVEEFYSANTPVLVGSVTSNSTGAERVERARIAGASATTACGASPCTVYRQSGTWISSVTRASTGNYTINFVSGTFSDVPVCGVINISNPSAGGQGVMTPTASSSTVLTIRTDTAAVIDSYFDIICMGPR